MEGRKKVLILLTVVALFFTGFSLTPTTSTARRTYAIRYVSEGETSHIEIITHKEIQELTIQALDEDGEVTHFLMLEDYLSKNFVSRKKNIFYITNKTKGLDDIHELILISGGNIRIPININNIEENDNVLEVMAYTSKEGNEENVNMLKIMSYNIHHGRDLYGRYSLDQIVDVIKESGADIIGIQEAENGVIRSRFKDQMKYLSEELSMHYVYGNNIALLGGMYGNGILSRYPIESYENLHLPSGREQRGLLSATINVNGNKLNFLTTHLGLNQQERNKQVNAINKYLDTLPHNTILVGDLNARPDNEIVKKISRRLVDTAYAMDQGHLPTFDLPVLSGRIDYVFVDNNFTIKNYKVIKSRASDHYPVITSIGIP
ncbi:MAG: endonuclease/exonuclease/phosphatase family protein [Clostridiaceae bacterium]|nr:endonuclease/exonuclease/phosphatase family protein [Clostridiaceae bacterium]